MAEQKTIKFEIVTPERVVFRMEVKQITVPTGQGEITVLPDHIPLVANLLPGVIELVTADSQIEIISVSGGFIEVLKNKVVILADTAERAVEIDLKRAEEARTRAEKTKTDAKHAEDVSFTDSAAQLAKELARIKAVRRHRKIKNIE
jgi:F-type H+-transporting ATPase subunit epsilon